MALGGFAPLPLPLGGTALDGLTAEQHARLAADLAACVRTIPFAVLVFNMATGVVIGYTAQYGIGTSALPTRVDNGVGDWTIQWEPSYLDEYENAYPVNLKYATATPVTLGTARIVVANMVDRRTVRLNGFDSAGAPSDISVVLVVY